MSRDTESLVIYLRKLANANNIFTYANIHISIRVVPEAFNSCDIVETKSYR